MAKSPMMGILDKKATKGLISGEMEKSVNPVAFSGCKEAYMIAMVLPMAWPIHAKGFSSKQSWMHGRRKKTKKEIV